MLRSTRVVQSGGGGSWKAWRMLRLPRCMLPPPAQIPPARIPQWHLWTIGRQQSRSSVSAGTILRRPPRGAPPAGGSVRAGVEAAGSWAGRAGRRRSGELLWRRRWDGPTRASWLPRRHGRRTQAPRDGWWLAPTCRKHAATSPDRPRPDLRAGMRTKMCSARRQAGRLALGRNGQARPLSPVPIDTWHAYQPCGAFGVGRSGPAGWLQP